MWLPHILRLAADLAAATSGSEMILMTLTELSEEVANKIRNDDARISTQAGRASIGNNKDKTY